MANSKENPGLKEAIAKVDDNKIDNKDAQDIQKVLDNSSDKDYESFFADTNNIVLYQNFLAKIQNNLIAYINILGPTNNIGTTPGTNIDIQTTITNFNQKLQNEYKRITDLPKPKIEKKEAIFDANDPLNSMLINIKDKLPNSAKENFKETSETLRNKMKSNILTSIQTQLDNDGQFNKLSKEKQEIIKKHIISSITFELGHNADGKEGNDKLNNMIIAGLFTATTGLKEKYITGSNVENNATFNLELATILKSVNDIQSIVNIISGGKDIGSLFTNTEKGIATKIKDALPTGRQLFWSSSEKVEENLTETKSIENAVHGIFTENIKLNTMNEAVHTIEDGLKLTHRDDKDIPTDPKAMQDLILKNLHDITDKVPTNDEEKEALKIELTQNKFSKNKNIMLMIYNILTSLHLGDLLHNFPFFETALLSKERNYAKDALTYYNKNKDPKASFVFSDLVNTGITNTTNKDSIKKIGEKIDIIKLHGTLDQCKKFLIPIDASGIKDKDGTISDDSLNTAMNNYIKEIGNKWEEPQIERKIIDKKAGTETIKKYSYKDIFTNESDLVENFLQYVQTGKYPDGYDDKATFESMHDLGKVKVDDPTVVPPVTNTNNTPVINNNVTEKQPENIEIKGKASNILKQSRNLPQDLTTLLDLPTGVTVTDIKWKNNKAPVPDVLGTQNRIMIATVQGVQKEIPIKVKIVK